ncbi:MAG: inorganic phosphate transporter family protein [Bacteroidales bacterium]|jgi:phosphate/sulfate permease|nr:inorganic phosphate transporter family protein [Bacteroidales bacterium]MCU0407970.1 inorganic phosphate transporter family protein [Bacteroidales bacterium]
MISHLLVPFLVALFLAINMGGSGTGPAFSVAYGVNAIKKSLIPGLFGIMVFIGAITAGKATATTMGKELLDPERMTVVLVTIILLSVSISLLIANLAGIPQSTSQSTVFAISAPAIYFNSFSSQKLFLEIIPAWFILPLISFFICFLAGKYIYTPLRRRGWTISKRVNNSPILMSLIVITSLYVAFSIGANNVANASGPVASMTMNELNITNESKFIFIMILSTLVVAPSFGIGSSIFGHKIVQNTGKEIVLFGRIEAVIIAFVSASLMLLASVSKGIPTSLVQLNVASILGIGVAKLGFRNIFMKTEVNKFFAMWVISPVVAFSLSFILTFIASKMGWI